jgi:drug/metabolite transporter (DMT)-like permease
MSTSVFLIALAAPFLWAIVNHADKFLLSKYFKSGGVGGLMIFSTLFSVVLLPLIYLMDSNVLSIDIQGALVLMLAGALNAISILLYLYALNDDEASVVVPFMQLVPLFSFIFGYILLGDTLTQVQIVGGLIILMGTLILSFGMGDNKKIRFKWKVSLLMIAHSVLFALYGTLFKLISLNDGFWSGAFWEAIGLILVGIVLFCIPSYRGQFFSVFKQNSKPIIGINVVSEILTIAGNWLTAYATLLAPIALITLVSGYQPIFVFIIGIAITLLAPKLVKEKINRGALLHKGIAIALIIFGTYWL